MKLKQVCCTADGIGDVLMTLTCCAGLKHNDPNSFIVFSLLGTAKIGAPWQLHWVHLFDGYDQLRLNALPINPTYYPNENYAEQNKTRLEKPRYLWYSDACETTPKLPKLKPLTQDALAFAEQYSGCVVLSPFSAWNCRAWMVSHWLYLERLLTESNRRVVILDGRTPDKKRTDPFKSVVLRDESAARVTAVLKTASHFIGGDSGMTHLAGLLGTPSIALCAQIKGENIFGMYPSVNVINTPLSCGGCHWQGEHGWAKHCDTLCAGLQSITPETVMQKLTPV